MDIWNELNGRVCLVTAASRKLGAEIARRLAYYGVHVGVNYRDSATEARRLSVELGRLGVNAVPVRADVSDPDQVSHLVEVTRRELGAIDILVNNAGPYVDAPYLDLSLPDFERIMAGNVRATFLLSQLVGRQMKAGGSGHIVNIAATSALHHGHSVYSLAKAGVLHLTRSLALELGPEVRVNAIAPGLLAENEDMSAAFAEQVVAITPLGRLASRADIAEMVCLLCSSVFGMVTGQAIVVDGGCSIPRAG